MWYNVKKCRIGECDMAEKQMTIADLNVVFGKEEEPLLKRMDDIVLPALQSGIIRPGIRKYRDFCLKIVRL